MRNVPETLADQDVGSIQRTLLWAVKVIGEDICDLDGDGDGWGCE